MVEAFGYHLAYVGDECEMPQSALDEQVCGGLPYGVVVGDNPYRRRWGAILAVGVVHYDDWNVGEAPSEIAPDRVEVADCAVGGRDDQVRIALRLERRLRGLRKRERVQLPSGCRRAEYF